MDWKYLVERESVRIEWKENVANPQNVVKTLSAFANDFHQVGGGRVVCGLKEEKNEAGKPVAVVVGLEEKRFKEIKSKVLDYCHRYVDPPLTPQVEEYPVIHDSSLRILVFAVTSSPFAHRYRTKKEDVNYYVRIDDETRTATGLIPQLLELKRIWPPHMEQTHPDADMDSIDLIALKEFLGKKKRPHPVEKYLEPDIQIRGDVQCLATHPPGGSSRVTPRNFAILLFGNEPHRLFRGAYAILSVYKGKSKSSERSQRFVVFGPIPTLIRNLMERLQMYMGMNIDKSEKPLSGKVNQERYAECAVQEAIVNAFVHRDYHDYDPVRVVVFEDRIQVISPGGPIVPMDPEGIRKGEFYTKWRNPSLAWFMVELGFAQNEGQGIRIIVELTKQFAGQEPVFNISSHFFDVIIPAYNPLLVDLQVIRNAGAVNTQANITGAATTNLRLDIDVRAELPVFEDMFHRLKENLMVLPETDDSLRKELTRIEESLDKINLESQKKELIPSFKKLGRLLKKLNDPGSEWNLITKSSKTIQKQVRELEGLYNKFAKWLALPLIREV